MLLGVLRRNAVCSVGNGSRWRLLLRRIAAKNQFTSSGANWMLVHPEVCDAVASCRPVVALETTIVTHGMPHPENVEMALEVEEIVRRGRATPATIGVLEGRVHVGMTRVQLERLADPQCKESNVKISRRDLSVVLSQGLSGGTTVSATMLCAHKAGIPVFVTGGIGGVHREGEKNVSADLTELGRTPVAVVCAGVKSILDIGRTLEYLETEGVTVASFGSDSRDFPAFFSAKSGFRAPYNITSAEDAARVIDANLSFGVGSGVLIAVPFSSSLGEEIETAIQKALSDAQCAGITGKAVTPFVLQRVNELTGGKSLRANIDLIRNNARVGSEIAVKLAQIRQHSRHCYSTKDGSSVNTRSGGSRKPSVGSCHANRGGGRGLKKDTPPSDEWQPVVIGGSILDLTAKIQSQKIMNEGTNPGSLVHTFGGVGRNVAECMTRLGTPPFFISAVGSDENGKLITSYLEESGMSLSGFCESDQFPTASYCAVLDHRGELYCAIGDMDIHQSIDVDWMRRFTDHLCQSPFVCLDGNIPLETIEYVCNLCNEAKVPVWYEPTCVDKAVKPITAGVYPLLTWTSPNLPELRAMYRAVTGKQAKSTLTNELSLEDKLTECRQLVRPLLHHIPNIVVSLGKDGVLVGVREAEECLHYPPAAEHLLPANVLSVTGAGDSFVGAVMVSLIRGLSRDLSIKAGLRAAFMSLHSPHAVSKELNPSFLTEESISDWAPWEASHML